MSCEVAVSQCKTWIESRICCQITMESALAAITRAAQVGAEHEIGDFLFDMRDGENVKTPVHDYHLTHHHLHGLGYSRTSRMAFLVAEEDTSHDFFQITAANAGYSQCRVFKDEETATSWLRREDSLPDRTAND
jgi:hypothetical protein